MVESLLGHLVEPLRERLLEWGVSVTAYCERTGERPAVSTCDIIPPEVLAAFGVRLLRVPSHIARTGSCDITTVGDFEKIHAAEPYLVTPGGLTAFKGIPASITFGTSPGWGEKAAGELHYGLDAFVRHIGFEGMNALDGTRLSEYVEEYNAVRRIIRGIAGYRTEKPSLLTNAELLSLFDAAVCLPPEMTLPHLALCLEAASSDKTAAPSGRPQLMVSGGHLSDWGVLDRIEGADCTVAEDDLCNGRRQFDLSHNPASQYLYYEIIDACSYRPYCPALRNVQERYELIYRLLGNYDIRMVVLLSDTPGGYSGESLEWLRIRLMRSGIDPLVVDSASAGERVGDYLRAVDR